MRRRRKTNDQNARLRIAEARQWFRPIIRSNESPRRFLRTSFAPSDKAGTLAASDYCLVEPLKPVHLLCCYHTDLKNSSLRPPLCGPVSFAIGYHVWRVDFEDA